MAYLTRDKVKQLLDNRPQGVTPQQVIQGLESKGHQIEGYNEVSPAPQRESYANYGSNVGKVMEQDVGARVTQAKIQDATVGAVGRYAQDRIFNAPGETMDAKAANAAANVAADVITYPRHVFDWGKQALTGLAKTGLGVLKTTAKSAAFLNPFDQRSESQKKVDVLESATEAGSGAVEFLTSPMRMLPDVAQEGLGTIWHETFDKGVGSAVQAAQKATGFDPNSEEGKVWQDFIVTAANLAVMGKHAGKAAKPTLELGRATYDLGRQAAKTAYKGAKALGEKAGIPEGAALGVIASPTGVGIETAKTARTGGLMEVINESPDVITNAISQDVMGGIDQFMKAKSEVGQAYDPIRGARTPVQGGEGFVRPLIEKLGYTINEKGKLESTGYRKISEGKAKLQELWNDYGDKALDSESMLALRERLAEIGNYETAPGSRVKPLEGWARNARESLNKQFRGQVEGLEGLDAQIAPMLESAKQLRGVLKGLTDQYGNLRPQALGLLGDIASGKKGEFTKVLQEAVTMKENTAPAKQVAWNKFVKQVGIAKALQDIARVDSSKTSLGVKGGIIGGALAAAPATGGLSLIGGVGMMLITNPKFVLPLLERGGRFIDGFKTKAIEIDGKLEAGEPLSKTDVKFIKDSLSNVTGEEAGKVVAVDAINQLNDTLHQKVAENMPEPLKKVLVDVTSMRKVLESNKLAKMFNEAYDKAKYDAEFKRELTALKKTLGQNPTLPLGKLMSAVREFQSVDINVLEKPYLGEIRLDIVSYLLGEANKQTNGSLGRYVEQLGKHEQQMLSEKQGQVSVGDRGKFAQLKGEGRPGIDYPAAPQEPSGFKTGATPESTVLKGSQPSHFVVEEALKAKSADEFVKTMQIKGQLSNGAKVQPIDLTKIKGSDYPELDAALKSGKKLSLDEANNIVTDNEMMSKKNPNLPPIEVIKNSDGTYNLQAGNHRVAQALVNGDKSIYANVKGDISGIGFKELYNKVNEPAFQKILKSQSNCCNEFRKVFYDNPSAEPVRGIVAKTLDEAKGNYKSNLANKRMTSLDGFNHVASKVDGKLLNAIPENSANGSKFFSESEIKGRN